MRKTVIAIICLGLLALAVIGAVVFVKTAPKAEKKQPPKMAPLVETQALERTDETVVLHLTGTVVPAEQVHLSAQVGGEIISISPNFIDGGLLEKGAKVLQIDPIDYELALAAAESQLATAQFNHKMEIGRHDVAQSEWELLKTEDATAQEMELALRTPHLASSKASLQAAEAAMKKAQLDLSRTQVRTPFNAVVLARIVSIGSQPPPGGDLALLVGTDAYYVKVSIPVDRLPWLDIPGSTVKVISSSGAVLKGRVIKLMGDIERNGRMARILVEVEDPLCLKPENKPGKPLLLSEYVQTEIEGRELQGVYSIPRNALRENNRVWLVRDGKLDIREAEVLWRGVRNVLIHAPLTEGGDGGFKLVVSDMATPIQSMNVNTGNPVSEE